jgi:hypothetical protein
MTAGPDVVCDIAGARRRMRQGEATACNGQFRAPLGTSMSEVAAGCP